MKRVLRRYRLAITLGLFFIIISTILISIKVKAGPIEWSPLGGYVTSPALDLSLIGVSPKCFYNSTGNNYFLPFRSWTEYNAVINNGPPVGINQTACCDNNVPATVYSVAAYFTQHDCGHTPACYLQNTLGYNARAESNAGATCGISGRWRAVQCASLLHKTTMCNGDPCMNGIDTSSGYGNPKYCFGHYDILLRTCVYEGKTAVMSSGDGVVTYATPVGGGVTTYNDTGSYNTTNATYGACQTQVQCGDLNYAPQYGL